MANGRTYANTWFVCGDAQATLEALLPRIEGRMKIDPGLPHGLHRAAADRARGFPRHARRLQQLLRSAAHRDAEGRDLGARRDAEQHHLGQSHLPSLQPASERFPVGAGIGQGLSLGSVRRPPRTDARPW